MNDVRLTSHIGKEQRRAIFWSSLMTGIVACAGLGTLAGGLIALTHGVPPMEGGVVVALAMLGLFLWGVTVGACTAGFLALLVTPLAALFAWPLFRRDVHSIVPYVLAGAAAAAVIPLLVLIGQIMASTRVEVGLALGSIAAVSLVGAIGGFIAARHMRRELRKEAAKP